MLKNPKSFTLISPITTHGDKIDLGGGISASLSICDRGNIRWNDVDDVVIYFAKLNAVDKSDNVFLTERVRIVSEKSVVKNVSDNKTRKMLNDLVIKDNKESQEIAIRSILEKLPSVFQKKISDNLKQNAFLNSALGKE